MSENRAQRRLGRVLLLVPYAIHNPGATLGELAQRFGVSEREVRADLEMLFLCGLPGYGPGDLIEVDLTDDRVTVRMADYFSQPLRLTPAEALTLYGAGATTLALPGMDAADALERGLRKLGRALGLPEDRTGVDVAVEGQGGEQLEMLRSALAGRKRVHIEYFSATRGELGERDVDPWAVIVALGRWYLIGFDHRSGEERMFRVDRIKSVAELEHEANPPDDLDIARYGRAFYDREDQPSMTIEVTPAVARWFEDYYPVRSATTLDDGWVRYELAFASDRWAAVLVLSLGDGIRAVEPPRLLEVARDLAGAVARRHN